MHSPAPNRSLYSRVGASSEQLARLASGGLFHARSALLGAATLALLLLSFYALTNDTLSVSRMFGMDQQSTGRQSSTVPSTATSRTPYEQLDTHAHARRAESTLR